MRISEYLGVSRRREVEPSRGVRVVAAVGLVVIIVAIWAVMKSDLSTAVQIGLIAAVAMVAGGCIGVTTVVVDGRRSVARKD